MRRFGRLFALAGGALLVGGPLGVWGATALAPAPAGAAACSLSSGAGSCTISTSVIVSAGTLTLKASPNLYWNFVLDGSDQWASASASSLSGCTASSGGTTCSGGTAPKLQVLDATGSGSGWALSAYLSSNDLPGASLFHFDGAGTSTVGNSQNATTGVDPFGSVTPANACDAGAACTVATPASSCSHAGLGFSACPTYPVNMAAGTSAVSQVDLYSAAASTGIGAICLGSGVVTGAGCVGLTPSDYFNVGVPSSTAIGTYNTTTITVTASSGP